MNKANLLRVADAIEKHEIKWLGFNMATFCDDGVGPDSPFSDKFHTCNTTACVAGWTVATINKVDNYKVLDKFDISDTATYHLDLTDFEADDLFCSHPYHMRFADITPGQAVRTLCYAAEHGVIDWDAANPPEA